MRKVIPLILLLIWSAMLYDAGGQVVRGKVSISGRTSMGTHASMVVVILSDDHGEADAYFPSIDYPINPAAPVSTTTADLIDQVRAVHPDLIISDGDFGHWAIPMEYSGYFTQSSTAVASTGSHTVSINPSSTYTEFGGITPNPDNTVTGSIDAPSLLHVGALVSVYDDVNGSNFEIVTVTSRTTSTMTAVFAKTHPSGFIMRCHSMSQYWDYVLQGKVLGTDGNHDTYCSNGGVAGCATNSSTTSTIGMGSKTFTVVTGMNYTVGTRAQVAATGSTANSMSGAVTTSSGTTLTINVDSTTGSGTFSAWDVAQIPPGPINMLTFFAPMWRNAGTPGKPYYAVKFNNLLSVVAVDSMATCGATYCGDGVTYGSTQELALRSALNSPGLGSTWTITSQHYGPRNTCDNASTSFALGSAVDAAFFGHMHLLQVMMAPQCIGSGCTSTKLVPVNDLSISTHMPHDPMDECDRGGVYAPGHFCPGCTELVLSSYALTNSDNSGPALRAYGRLDISANQMKFQAIDQHGALMCDYFTPANCATWTLSK